MPLPVVRDETPQLSEGGSYSIETVSVGCKIYVQRPLETGEVEERKAEVLSVRDKSQSLYGATSSSSSSPAPEDRLEYYIHWVDFNKRLDEWIPGSRLILSKELEWPKPKVPGSAGKAGKKDGGAQPGKVARNPSLLKKATSQAASSRATPLPGTPQKRKGGYDDSQPDTPGVSQQDTPNQTQDDMMDLDEDAIGEEDTTLLSPVDPRKPTATFSKEQEIEKLRHSGSMTQSVHEIARVKNLNRLQIGGHIVEAWYFSPYPSEYAHVPILFICEFCLSYFPQKGMYGRHREKCRLLHPPGNEIYRYQDISFFEIDGRRQLIWCRNLSLLSKCFLDHKTLYYDVQPFLYYVMTIRDTHGHHILGYFSKEKESLENYNVACILTLPQYQRHGYGKLLIEFSYELSKRENKLGSPEKPLSDLGLLGYRAYWAEAIIEVLLNGEDDISIEEIAHRTSITTADIIYTLQSLQMLKIHRNQSVITLTEAIKSQHAKQMKKRKRRIEPNALQWKVPVFTREQLRFGF